MERALSIEAMQAIKAAEGYLQLEMSEAALVELDRLEVLDQGHPVALLYRSKAHMDEKNFERAAVVADVGISAYPLRAEFYFLKAFALAGTGDSWSAKQALLRAPNTIQQTGEFHYNLARYEAELGNIESARQHLALAESLSQVEQGKTSQEMNVLLN